MEDEIEMSQFLYCHHQIERKKLMLETGRIPALRQPRGKKVQNSVILTIKTWEKG